MIATRTAPFHALRLAPLLALAVACGDGRRELLPTPAEPAAEHAAADAETPAGATPAADPWWQAVRHLELDRAHALDDDADRRRFLEVLDLAIEQGSEGAEAELCALTSAASEPTLRRWAGQTALNLLRIEARWEAMDGFGTRCSVSLRDGGTVLSAFLKLPTETVVPPEEPVVLPLRTTPSGLPLVTARLVGPGGDATVSVLLDTGAGLCMLTAELAGRLGIATRGEQGVPILGSSGHGVDGLPAALDELHLGDWRVDDLPCVVVETRALHEVLPGVDAVVGWELFREIALEISGVAEEVVLRRSTPRADGEPLNLVLLYQPVVRMSSGEHELLFLLDTGCSSTDATPSLVTRLGLTDLPTVEDATRGLGAERRAVVPVLPELPFALGGTSMTLGNVSVWDMPAESGELLDLDGTLGVDVALAGRLVIDGPARRVTLHAR